MSPSLAATARVFFSGSIRIGVIRSRSAASIAPFQRVVAARVNGPPHALINPGIGPRAATGQVPQRMADLLPGRQSGVVGAIDRGWPGAASGRPIDPLLADHGIVTLTSGSLPLLRSRPKRGSPSALSPASSRKRCTRATAGR